MIQIRKFGLRKYLPNHNLLDVTSETIPFWTTTYDIQNKYIMRNSKHFPTLYFYADSENITLMLTSGSYTVLAQWSRIKNTKLSVVSLTLQVVCIPLLSNLDWWLSCWSSNATTRTSTRRRIVFVQIGARCFLWSMAVIFGIKSAKKSSKLTPPPKCSTNLLD